MISDRERLASYNTAPLREQKEYAVIGKLHMACTQIRLAIAVYEREVPEGESASERLKEAADIINEVRSEIAD